ncbi:MAG: helix-turn-helix transcriptional regulator [Lachnospiraceae bacterium]|jgi:DNA-binding XRE family transcriptional regulator|nr:helix-turn-helix transcriptional regulator [Lachnospiraceae bacterium]
MAMRAYKETYLNNAAKNLGCMLDYAVNDCGMSGGLILHMFITSGLAPQYERGNTKVIAGMSGIELAMQSVEAVAGVKLIEPPTERDYRTAEYWAGWALAHYQWYTAMSFAQILRFLPYDTLMQMYPTMHEADITKFYASANEIRARVCPQTNLKRCRESAELSQSQLAKQAEVSLRSIQMYEQRNKNINKAQAITLAKMARVLGCHVESLLESEA